MILSFDGGAFQQGIAGGILNVAVNFINAASAADPSVRFILLADPTFGEVREHFLAKLDVRPDVLYRAVLPKKVHDDKLLTLDPAIQVLIDGVEAPFSVDEAVIVFKGNASPRTVEIISRSGRPCDSFEGSLDNRQLGLSFSRIEVVDEKTTLTYFADDVRFDAGNSGNEGQFRWTTGHFKLPTEMLPKSRDWTLTFHRAVGFIYSLGGGRHDSRYAAIVQKTEQMRRAALLVDLGRELKDLGVDGYVANHFLPIAIPGLVLFTWAYDIIPVVHPEFFDKDALDNFVSVVAVIEAADAAFCISKFTHDSIVKHLRVDKTRVHVSWIGASPAIYRRSPDEIAALKTRLEIKNPYLLCVATIEPRKNHVGLAEAYNLLVQRNPTAPDLIVAGSRGWGYAAFFETIERYDLQDRIRHFENLSDDDIAALYSGAEALVYPSLFEGFGLPVLEAMKCGVPVVTSRGTSMEDIAQGCSALVDPKSALSITQGIEILLRDSHMRARHLTIAAERLPQFDWAVIAGFVLATMRNALQ